MRTEAAKALLETGAVFFRPEEPFTWASGIKSPVYTDNRLVLTDPKARRVIEEGLISLIKETYPQVEALFGTATAGIPHAAIAGYAMDLPMGYVRSSAKDHGRTNRIEGRLKEDQKVVVIEDLISTGGSVISAAQALREAGAQVLGVICIFSYNLAKAEAAFGQAGLEYRSLTDFDTVAKAAAEGGYIGEGDIAQLMEFRNSL
ncbi:MAG: orotate phosphoribosyltransferase [Firmicutes bacterium]|nr:orotate phosphoribosyltransferase [Bacillota bacterium]